MTKKKNTAKKSNRLQIAARVMAIVMILLMVIVFSVGVVAPLLG